MEFNNSFGTGLAVGALIVVIIGVLVWPRPEPKPKPSSEEVQLVVRYTLNHNTNKFDFSFEDGAGNALKKIELKDPNNPLGELAAGRPDGKLNVTHGVDGATFVTSYSHGSIRSCVGIFCSCSGSNC